VRLLEETSNGARSLPLVLWPGRYAGKLAVPVAGRERSGVVARVVPAAARTGVLPGHPDAGSGNGPGEKDGHGGSPRAVSGGCESDCMESRAPDADAVTDYWETAAPTYDDAPDHGLRDPATRAAWARRLAEWVPQPAGSVLDAGCGTGSLSVLLGQAGHVVTGVDGAPGMVRRARAKAEAAGVRARFLPGEAGDPPVGDRPFDAVLVRHVLWTLPDPHAALRRWRSLLRPGGRLVLVEGRWGPPAAGGAPYVAGAEHLPWGDGVEADRLTEAVAPLVADLEIVPLAGDPALWGGPVHDERYALVARC
jgi:SAM-dependent methyltransferase